MGAQFAMTPFGHRPHHSKHSAARGDKLRLGRQSPRASRLSNLRPRQIPPHLVLPGRVASQHLAPDRDFEGPVGQLRLRRLLLPPPAAHPPVAPPGPGLGRAGRAKRSRSLGSRVTTLGAAVADSAVWFGSAVYLSTLGQAVELSSLGQDQVPRREEQRSAARPPADVSTQPISGRAAIRIKKVSVVSAQALYAGRK